MLTLGGGDYTLTIPALGTVVLGTATTNQVAYWAGHEHAHRRRRHDPRCYKQSPHAWRAHVGTATGATAGPGQNAGTNNDGEYIQTNDGKPVGSWTVGSDPNFPLGEFLSPNCDVKYWIPATQRRRRNLKVAITAKPARTRSAKRKSWYAS